MKPRKSSWKMNFILLDYLEFLSETGKNGSLKNDKDIDDYLNDYKEEDDLSKSGENLFRKAINRFYRLQKEK
ncbi:MAG: hypothetical protein PVI62_14845 [Desulfobacterales bacterium]